MMEEPFLVDIGYPCFFRKCSSCIVLSKISIRVVKGALGVFTDEFIELKIKQ